MYSSLKRINRYKRKRFYEILSTSIQSKRIFAKILRLFFLTETGVIALLLFLLSLDSDGWTENSPGGFGEPKIAVLLWCLVVSAGLLLIYAGRRFPALRPGMWGILLTLVGTIAGSVLSLFIVSYQDVCCMFGYTIVNGYPLSIITRTVVLDTYIPWPQLYIYMQTSPGQVHWEISWISLLLTILFYAHATLIPVVILRSLIYRIVRIKRFL